MRRIAIMLAVTLALPVVVSPAVAYADCNLAVAVPNHASDARGVAFVGRFLGGERGAKPGIRRLTFSTSQRYGLGAGSTVTLRGDVCGIAGSFTAGRRHFVSTAESAAAWSDSTVAWRVRPDGTVRLIALNGEIGDDPPRVREVETLAQAVALMAPHPGR